MKVVDLFSGCGGLSTGFQRAGFEVISAYDNWSAAVMTYRANFQHPIYEQEITPETDLPSADVIIGGPPCQGFSSAGLRRSGDHRNSLVSVFSGLVARNRPKAFVFENVEGFLTGEGGTHVFSLLEPLVEAGYQIHLRKVNASTFGVPQHRKRVIAVGGLGWAPSFPAHTHASHGAPGATLLNRVDMPIVPSVWDTISDLPTPEEHRRGNEPSFPDHSFSPFGEGDAVRARLLKPGQRMRDLPEEYWHESYKKRANRRVMDGTPTERRGGAPSGLRRLIPEEPSKAITGGALREFVHPTQDRPLTVRECARLQTFPDEFVFLGSQSEKIQMVGNAVPVLLGQRIAEGLMSDLQRATQSNQPGQLLSFIPTVASAMSPALRKTTEAVNERFLTATFQKQGKLCL